MIPQLEKDAYRRVSALTGSMVKAHNGAMRQQTSNFDRQQAWDRASAHYLARRGDNVGVVSYGNLSPGEDELALLGDLRDKRVLDFGCGGGHNAIACARAGALVVGVDVSNAQLGAARRLAEGHGVEVEWLHGDDFSLVSKIEPFDILLMVQLLPYVADPARLLRQGRQMVRPGGRMVASLDHPIRNCFYDGEMEELNPYPVLSYFARPSLLWHFEPGVPMRSQHLSLGEWIDLVVQAGFDVRQVIEAPAAQSVCDELWPEDSPLAPLRLIPHTAILVADVAR